MKQTIKQVCGLLLFTLLSLSSYAQQTNGERIIITGKVIDNTNLGMPGVNIVEKGAKSSTVTDIDGNYKISVNKGAVLSFAFIGMNKVEKTVGNTATVINVTMKDDATQLEQVVVVGYGTQKKGNLTGAIETINAEKLQDLPVSNLSESLRGQIVGLNVGGNGTRRPGETATLEIRQTFGFTNATNKTPLIVIDDQIQVDPQTGLSTLDAFNRLDPSEIESITVLKDGSAAIYGSRASQGAIVVKTKRGKAGKMRFSYINQFGINDAVSHVKTMNAYESGIYSNRVMQALGNDPATSSKFYSPAELEEMKSLNYNWLDKAWKPAEQQKHSLTISGGDEKATYFAGLTYFTQGANLGEQDYQKWNFRTGMNAKITKDLDFTASVSGNSGDIEKSFTKSNSSVANPYGATNAEQADYGHLLHMPKFVPITTIVNGQEYYMSPFNRADGNLGGTQNSNSSIAGWNYFALLNNGSKSVSSDFSYNVNAAINYKVPFIKGLALRGSFARTQTSSSTSQVALAFPLARITNFTAAGHHLASAATAADYSIADNVRQARVTYDNTNSKSTQANFFATYARTFGNHDIDAMFSVERSETNYDSAILYFDRGTKTSKDLYLGTSLTAGDLTPGFSNNFLSESGTMSYLGRVNYSYKSKYLLQFIVRRDASTKFAPENYWGTFPGLQAGWVASKEDWFEKVLPAIDYLKFRYSLGKTGNDNIGAWRWATFYDIVSDKGLQFGSNGGTLGNAIAPRPNPNRNATWDTHIKHDLGIDFNVFNNRLQVSADYYYDKGTDMLVSGAGILDVPISVGGAFAEANIAGVNSWGTEFSLKWSDHIKDNFSYNIGVNFGLFAGNETTAYPDGALTDPSTNQQRTGASSYNPIWGFKVWKGTSAGDGILRTDEDITNYWNYLTANATASGVAGAKPNFLGIVDVINVKKGMLAYQDLAGTFVPATGLKPGADGKIARNDDYGKLVNSNRTYGFTTNLGFKYSSVYLNTQIGTSWGGIRNIDNVEQRTSTNDAYWARETFWKDMYGYDNVNGKYPNVAFRDNVSNPSDFWQISTFSCSVRNLTLGYEFPELFTSQLGISRATFGVTGYNLWYFNNPFPEHYRNMYDSSTAGYPTLRTWSLNLNITF